MDDIKRPILGNGQEYIAPYDKDSGQLKEDKRPSFDEAKSRLLSELGRIKGDIKRISEDYKLDEIIINLRMNVDYSSKSYYPEALITRSAAEEVGSKKWSKTVVNKKSQRKVKFGKDIFLKISEDKLSEFESLLLQNDVNFSKKFAEDIRNVEEMYFDDHSTIINIFGTDWTEGRIEIVIHPFGKKEKDVINKLLDLIKKNGGDTNKVSIRSYYPGPIFISAYLRRTTLEKILPFNPIRTAHPLEFKGLPKIRGGLTNFTLPRQSNSNMKSNIILGVFDGGINPDIPHLESYVSEFETIKTQKDKDYLQHGIGVVGAALYGDLKKYSSNDILPTPPISVHSFRVFPLSDPKDYDLYEVIDIIEKEVPKNPNIKVYNLSLGPYGPIEDDYISRFTYVIDELSKDNKRWFAIAVGNDGDLPNDDDKRIQAPADAVNNLGVGAFTYDNCNNIIRAPYSCIGDGREGCKVKPDIVAFGGCDKNPFQLIGVDGACKYFAQGTSFASPLVARKAAEIIGRCNMVDPLLARALLIHTAKHPNGKHDKFLGYGALCEDTSEILGCNSNKVTVVYQSTILPSKYAKLNIPFLNNLDYSGKVEIEYTIAIMTPINPKDTEDYTLSCIEDTFYPNINIYTYSYKDPNTGKVGNKKRHKINQRDDIERLLSEGWSESKAPASDSKNSNKYKTEQERRANFKWDTVVKRRLPYARYSALEYPYLVIHAMERQNGVVEKLHYAAVITINYCDYDGNSYEETQQIYNKLEAARVRGVNEIMIHL
ncbi:S8 family peptidase [Pseudobacteroides cellulosolvens]|uniref:Peptidase S8 and S53 subtilisin kexin sedolisin n=1 Tax=Pseudobacteroides cellulosolvens ATCC 35603 = DSM 2933 TaxID=398512 RepID=A0A0L6JH39_9FIRM|nr:S8 family peptidase [Pseudobacteroides cellulosolvens]KNY24777.1 peptidase S8 and S53 subtilisin kexin sedolisin [Pseudobacteroides cellulosolvens ATCC 35603 = DSM 2933]